MARTLSNEDIEAIMDAIIRRRTPHECPVETPRLVAAVEFYENLNEFFTGTKKTIWNTVLISFIMLILGLIGIGVWIKSTNGGSS
jgi:hypothetical protein